MMRTVLLIVSGLTLSVLLLSFQSSRFERKDKLSEYNFFKGKLAELNPVEDVIPYDLNTPLFSNYAEKLRFIQLPKGTQAHYNDTATFEFPQGTVLIKNFIIPLILENHRRAEESWKLDC